MPKRNKREKMKINKCKKIPNTHKDKKNYTKKTQIGRMQKQVSAQVKWKHTDPL